MTTQLTELQKQSVHYADIKKRLYGKPNRPPIFKPPQPEEIPSFLNTMPSWKRDHTYFDEHILEWRRIFRNVSSSPVRAYVFRRAAQLGFTYDQMVGRSRKKEITNARALIWWEIKNYVKPSASYPEIGRLTGGFDHTSVLHGVKKIEKMKRGYSERAS